MWRAAFSPSFMVLSATWNALRGLPLPTSTTSPSEEEDATTAPLLPASLMLYLTATNQPL
jgi:hypothetical protein